MSRGGIRRRLLPALFGIAFAAAALSLAAGLWIPAKAALAQYLLERAWGRTAAGAIDVRPWPWADTAPLARLAIPALDTDWIVLSGASGRNLAFAPALIDGTARPGEVGVAVVAGHRDTHFRVLERVALGMEISLEDPAGRAYRYRVTGIEIMDATRSRLRLDAPLPMLVLTTCYPFDALTAGGPLRFVVTAESTAGAEADPGPGHTGLAVGSPRLAL
jgi:sortase A